jgi:hypothetical protein
MLTEHNVTRPSEVAAPVQAISTLGQAVMAIPGSIVKIRTDFTNSSDALVKARTTLLTDRIGVQTAAYTAKAALDNAQASLVTAQFADPQAYATALTNLLKAQQTLQQLISSSAAGGTGTTPVAATPAKP